MRSLKCPDCGGPIELADEESRTTCPYCGGALERTIEMPRRRGAAGAGPVVGIEIRRGGPLTRRAIGCTLLIVLGIAAVGAFIALRAARIGREVAASVAQTGRRLDSAHRAPADEPLPLERLADASFSGRHRIAAAPPASGLAAFEPVANLPWALALAQRWAPDARLWRIDVERLRPDGTVNVADDPHAEVTYRFASPRRVAAFRERANLEPEAQGDFELWVAVEQGAIFAYQLATLPQIAAIQYEELDRLDYPKSRPLPEILAENGRRPELPEVPFYKGYLIRLEREGWCWYLSTLSGQPNIPRLRARDGRMWPYS